MLTRVEIDGFKTFEQFTLNLGPFLVILGPNAAGKSNFFDAIQLLSRLAGGDLRTAVSDLRGEPSELFRRQVDGEPGTRMRFAAEVLLDPQVQDPWGARVQISHSRLRYEVEIERRKQVSGVERLFVAREEARPLLKKEDHWPEAVNASPSFRRAYLSYRRQAPFLRTDRDADRPRFSIHNDGQQGRTRSADAAEATILSSITSAEFKHLFALREEFRSYRFLQLDPVSLRRPSPTADADRLKPDGSNLAAVLARIAAETRTDNQPRGALSEVAADLAALIPGVTGLGVAEDRERREYRIEIGGRESRPFSARVVSDGTLRILALLTILHDPKYRGLVCLEEPENGVHPKRLESLIRTLRRLASDPTRGDADPSEPLSQMFLNSHSPVVLSCIKQEGLGLFADMVDLADPEHHEIRRKTRVRPIRPPGAPEGAHKPNGYVSLQEVRNYLATVDQGV